MRKVTLLFLLVSVFVLSGCFSNTNTSALGVLPTLAPTPASLGGFWYYEDPNLPAGFDLVFAVCEGKFLKLNQNGNGWNIKPILEAEFLQYPLSSVGQTSDYGRYKYRPESGEIWVDNEIAVKQSTSEYNPQYWFWAWTSLVFIKDCHLHIYYVKIHEDGRPTVSSCHVDFTDLYAACDEGFVVSG